MCIRASSCNVVIMSKHAMAHNHQIYECCMCLQPSSCAGQGLAGLGSAAVSQRCHHRGTGLPVCGLAPSAERSVSSI